MSSFYVKVTLLGMLSIQTLCFVEVVV